MTTIGDRVRELREAQGLTQEELAGACKISPTTISELEGGRSKGSKHLHRIAAALRTTPEHLAGEQRAAPAKVLPGELDPALLTIIVEGVEEALVGYRLPPRDKARLFVSCYELMSASEAKPTKAAIIQFARRFV